MGAAAGAKSGVQPGHGPVPVVLTSANTLQKILELASVLDEQNIPDTGAGS